MPGIEAFNRLYNLFILNEPKGVMVCIGSFKLQTMTAFNKKFLRGGTDVSRGRFFQKESPLAPVKPFSYE
jgi:hypothetical protein